MKTMVRSYDFEPIVGRGVCYIEGEVIRETDVYLVFKAMSRVWNGIVEGASDLPDEIHVLKQGRMIPDWSGRVTTWEV